LDDQNLVMKYLDLQLPKFKVIAQALVLYRTQIFIA